ncbi:MAG: ribonuclease E/G [Alkalilacustris sp.]
MKGAVTVLGQLEGRETAARIVDGRLEELLLADGPMAPGAILRGRVGRPVKGLGGAFVDLPGGATGFLKQTAGVRPGQGVVVQVAGVAEPGKALPLAARILLKGRLAIVTPGAPGVNAARGLRDAETRAALVATAEAALAEGLAEGLAEASPEDCGLILRTAAEAADPAAVRAEILSLLQQLAGLAADGPTALLHPAPGPHAVARRDWPDSDLLAEGPRALEDHGVEEMLDALRDPVVALDRGAHMAVETTRALVAVDVNTGPDGSPAAGLKANIAAARELPRQLRLRGLGGQVLVDFAPCPKRDRGTVQEALRAAFRREETGAVLAGWTPLGNFELQRRRDRRPLWELLSP